MDFYCWFFSSYAYLCNIVMFLSAVWPLILTAPIHYRGSIGEQVMWNFSVPCLLTFIYALSVNIFSAKLWVNYLFHQYSNSCQLKVHGSQGFWSITIRWPLSLALSPVWLCNSVSRKGGESQVKSSCCQILGWPCCVIWVWTLQWSARLSARVCVHWCMCVVRVWWKWLCKPQETIKMSGDRQSVPVLWLGKCNFVILL